VKRSLHHHTNTAPTTPPLHLKRTPSLKSDLKSWNREVFGNLHTTKGRILQELEDLDYKYCSGGLEESERFKEWS